MSGFFQLLFDYSDCSEYVSDFRVWTSAPNVQISGRAAQSAALGMGDEVGRFQADFFYEEFALDDLISTLHAKGVLQVAPKGG